MTKPFTVRKMSKRVLGDITDVDRYAVIDANSGRVIRTRLSQADAERDAAQLNAQQSALEPEAVA